MDYIQENDFSKIMILAISAALKAGEILKSGYRSNFKIKNKEGKHNLVTEYDLLSEKSILSMIKKEYPTHKILCEEEGYFENSSEFEWIVDPLDGTVNFAHEIPMFVVNIAVKKNDIIFAAVTFHPLLNELFYAEKGKGAFLNGSKLSVTKTDNLDKAILSTGFPYDLQNNPNNTKENFMKILDLGIPIRRIGSAALDLAYVAAGRFDAFFENSLSPWDIAAGLLLVEEAGGSVISMDGSKLQINDKADILATNKLLEKPLLKIFT